MIKRFKLLTIKHPNTIEQKNTMNYLTSGNKVALITGSAIRVGKEIAQKLHVNDYNICVHYNHSSCKAEKLVDKLNEKRANSAFLIQENLASKNSAKEVIKKFLKISQRLDLLVNNASVFHKNELDAPVEVWDSIHAVNLRSIYFLSTGLRSLLKQNDGSIINISDSNADFARKGYSIYSISKSGLNSLTRSLALELAPEVRVNGVGPGAIIWADSEDDTAREEIISKIPLKKIGHPNDIAEAVIFLAKSNYITGQTLNVDGGRSISI